MLIDIKDLYKIYNEGQESEVRALDGVSLQINRGEFVAIVGASGSGKSTMMNVLGCLDVPTRGEYILNGTQVTSLKDRELARIRNREIGFIFQGYNLLQDLDALDNVILPLIYRGTSIFEREELAMDALARVGMDGRAHHRPSQMSGGQQQRVAFARALVMGQDILLLDEPLSNLDAKLRVEVRTELRQLQQKLGITTIYVTHDQDEALSMSDIIAVMKGGRIEQIGSPWEIYFRPVNRFVADFVGTVNFLAGKVLRAEGRTLVIDYSGMELRVPGEVAVSPREAVTLVVRPECIHLAGSGEETSGGAVLDGVIENYSFLGRIIRYWVQVGPELFVIDDANVDLAGARTGAVKLCLDARKLHILKDGGGHAAS